MSTKFGVDSSSRFTVIVRTNRQTNRQTLRQTNKQTDATKRPAHAGEASGRHCMPSAGNMNEAIFAAVVSSAMKSYLPWRASLKS